MMEPFIKTNYLLYTCNAVSAIFGIVLIAVGSVMITLIGDFTKYPNAADIKTLPTLVILLGIVLVGVALFGCFGAYVENLVILYIYAFATFVAFILQLTMISWVFVNISKHPNSMSDLVTMAWLNNYHQYGFPMDVLQIQFDCCGRYGSSDYTDAGYKVPNSCCGSWILVDCPDKVYLRKPGCQREFYNFWTSNNDIIRFVGIVSAIALLISLFLTYILVKGLRQTSGSYY